MRVGGRKGRPEEEMNAGCRQIFMSEAGLTVKKKKRKTRRKKRGKTKHKQEKVTKESGKHKLQRRRNAE